MVGKKSGKALLREEGKSSMVLCSTLLNLTMCMVLGLERTDNSLDLTTWPLVNMINQKNYYTEYLKRDDQILPLRLLQEERRNRMTAKAKDRDRELAQGSANEVPPSGADLDMDEDVGMEDAGEPLTGQDALGSKVIVIHPGSQNLRIGLASDALPKTVPMVIARKWKMSESEEDGGEPLPKRRKLDNGSQMAPEKMFGDEVRHWINALDCHSQRSSLPNSTERCVPI